MAKRKFLLAIGQSNSTAVADAQSWEDKYPQIALRNPQVRATQYAEGVYTDTLTMPYTFPGGQQTNRFGTGPKPTAWQTVNCKGRAVQALRFLTFYEPLPTNLNVGTSYNLKYPGTCSVVFGSTPTTLITTQAWQYNPRGTQLIRKSTGATYTITSTTLGNTVTVTPDIVPAPQTNEEFQFSIKAGANSNNASEVRLTPRFGGLNDLGTALAPGAFVGSRVAQPTSGPFRLEFYDKPLREGQTVLLQAGNTILTQGQGFGASTSGSANIVLTNTPAGTAMSLAYFPVGQAVSFTAITSLPTPLVATRAYYVVSATGNTIQVSETQGGSALTLTATVAAFVVQQSIPNGITALTEYTIGKREDTETVIALTSITAGSTFNTATAHKLANGDVVRFNTNIQTLRSTLTYTVVEVGATTFKVAYAINQSPITLSNSTLTNATATRNSASSYFLRRPTTSTIASINTGTDTITLNAGHILSVGDTVTFTVSGGGSLPGGITLNTNYKIKTVATAPFYRDITLEDPAGPPATLNITSVGSGTITMTQVGGEAYLSCDGSCNLGTYVTEQWRGSMTGLMLRCTAGTSANVGQSRVMGDIFYDSANGVGVVELGVPFSATPQSGDTFVIEPPSQGGQTIPFHKWAMWLPWCPFEGSSFTTDALAGNLSSLPGQNESRILYGPSTPELFENTQVQFYSKPDEVLRIDSALASSTASQIITSGLTVNQYLFTVVEFVTGNLAGQRRQVDSNSATELNMLRPFSEAPQVGDTYRILYPNRHPDIVNGRSYYVTAVPGEVQSPGGAFYMSATYGGPDLTSTNDAGMACNLVVLPQNGRINPFPPGFNYPNHLTPIAAVHQPFDGPSLGDQPRIGHYVSTALKMHDYLGEMMYVIPLAFGGTGVSHKEALLGGDGGGGDAWYDPDQQISWSPGDPNNCFGRLLDVLDAAKMAWEAQGDTGECIGIVWAQGEEDGAWEDRANRYYNNCTTLKAAIRQALKDRGLYSGSAHRIPWIHPKIRTLWPYSSTLNAAIEKMVENDPYSRTFEVQDLPTLRDTVHYTGAGMSTMSERAFDAWLSIQKMGSNEVEICNLALANIGETAKVTSIEPPDGSAQAALCARFYPLARDTLLEMGSWSFAIKRKTLVEVDNPRTEWEYAYEVPGDASGILAVMPPDALDDWVMNAKFVPQKFVIETDVYGKRVLYTNQENAVARYNAKITDTTVFSNLFVIALSWHLSSMLAGPLIKGEVGAAESRRCAQMATAYMMQASSHDKTTQAEIKPTHTPSWISIR